jgi:hypothetical protein
MVWLLFQLVSTPLVPPPASSSLLLLLRDVSEVLL